MIYTVTLNPSIDCVMELDGIARGRVNRARTQAVHCGGKGVNVSLLLTRLGVENTALGFAAGFTGEAFGRELVRQGVRADFLRLPEGLTRINVKLRDGTETEINGPGPCPDAASLAALRERLASLGPDDTLVLAGSLPAGLPDNTYETFLALTQRRGVRAVVDTSGKALRRTLPYRPFLIKPNLAELEGLFGISCAARPQMEQCARRLQREGARSVLVSLAGDGAFLLDETGKSHFATAPRGVVRNSVGAGDAMVAGFLTGWQRTGDYAAALRWGIAAGSATAFTTGIAQKEDVLRFLDASGCDCPCNADAATL